MDIIKSPCSVPTAALPTVTVYTKQKVAYPHQAKQHYSHKNNHCFIILMKQTFDLEKYSALFTIICQPLTAQVLNQEKPSFYI
jgi:hypothetical protein